MRAREKLALLALTAAGAGCLHAHGSPDHPLVRGMDVDGADAVSASDIEQRLATQATGRFFWDEPQYLDADALASDKKRIERYYRAQGYYGAEVTAVDTPSAGDEAVRVVFHVKEGKPTRVEELAVTGLEGAPEVQKRLDDLPIKKGDVFTEDQFDAAGKALERWLHESGYARGEVKQRAEVTPEKRAARVTYAVTPGLRYHFGIVFVAGTAEVSRARIREEAEVAIKPGAWFDERALGKAQARVFDLAVFGGVRVSAGVPDDQRRTVPVVVAVREAPFRTVRAGPGIGIQTGRFDAHALASWTHRNWLGNLRHLELTARAGWAWLPNPWSNAKQGPVGLATADFTQPGALGRRVDFNVRLEGEAGLEQAFSFYSERARLALPLRIGRQWTVVPSYHLDLYQLSQTANVFGTATSQTNPLLASCPRGLCVLSYFEQRLAYDGRDDALNTRKGFYLGLSLQEGFRLFGVGTFRFVRLLPEGRVFFPLSKSVVVAARLRYGALRPLGDETSPIVSRFMAGGTGSFRGYQNNRFSPMVVTCGSCQNKYVPVGGDGLTDASLELRYPIAGDLGGVLFADAGNVTVNARDALDFGALQYAVGTGIRYRTMFGPLRLDFAFRLPRRFVPFDTTTVPVFVAAPNPQDPSAPAMLAPVGSHHEPYFAAQLSLGEAF